MVASTIDWDFHQSAKALVKALNQSVNHCGGASTSSSIFSSPVELTSWVIEANNDIIYLAHPPVLFRTNDDNSHWIEDNATIGEDEIDSSGSNVELDESIVDTCNPRHYDVTEWTFSVVFHDTWRVPTLYFHVHDIDGTPITRDKVVTILLSSTRGNETDTINTNGSMSEEQTWDFVSQEEHPMTGKPSFFLHPCQTAAKMELLLCQPKQYCPLLSWMSMILPSVGCTISPYVYHEAQKKMMSMTEETREAHQTY